MSMFNSSHFHHESPPGERRATASRVSEDLRLARHGVEIVAHGALICPECSAPIVAGEPIPAACELECGYCGHAARAREYLVRDVFDTVGNEAYMVARLPARVP